MIKETKVLSKEFYRIETDRLRIRLCQKSDVDTLWKIVSQERVQECSGQRFASELGFRRIYSRCDSLPDSTDWDLINFTIEKKGIDPKETTIIGSAQLAHLRYPGHSFDLEHVEWSKTMAFGITLDFAEWGKGYGTEATKAICLIASRLGFHTLVAETLETNIGMNRIFAKSGFLRVGTGKSGYIGDKECFYYLKLDSRSRVTPSKS